MATIAVVGATGFIGSRLVPALAAAGHRVRALGRRPEAIDAAPGVDRLRIDIDTGDGLADALDGVETAFWLVHRMKEGSDFAELDRHAAELFRDACTDAGVSRIVYMGGLGDDEPAKLSPHLRSRAEVGEVLRKGEVPVTELRAGVVLGAGGASFEMLRQLSEHLPVMVTPTWVTSLTQPIAVNDLVRICVDVATDPRAEGRVIDVGGPDVLTFQQMLERFAEHRGLAQWIFPVPVLSPALSARWVGLVTDVDPELARHLVDSLTNETTCGPDDVHAVLGPRELVPLEDAIDEAIDDARQRGLRTRLGRDARFLGALSVGVAANWLGIVSDRRDSTALVRAIVLLGALGATAVVKAHNEGLSLGDVDARSVGAGLAVGGVTAAASAGVVAVARNWGPFRHAARSVMARDTDPPTPALGLVAAGVCEELYWRGLLPAYGGRGKDVLSWAAWAAPVFAAREPLLILSAVTVGPIWTLLARRRGAVAAAVAHAVWLVATRAATRRALAPDGN